MGYPRIRTFLERNPAAKLGFVVYRCTYTSDADWDRFMNFLNTQTKTSLENAEMGDLFPRVDWNVQQDASLDGASFEVVRERFRHWVQESGEVLGASPRQRACVVVDQECLNSVLEWDGRDDEFDMFGVTFVELLSRYDEGGGDEDDSDEEEEDREEGDDEEGDEKAEKDRVSTTRVGISFLVPRVYSMLDLPGWHSFADPDGGVVTP